MIEQCDEPLGDEALDRIGDAIRSALPRGKHFVCCVLGEGPTKLEIVSDIPDPNATCSILEWGIKAISNTEEDHNNGYN